MRYEQFLLSIVVLLLFVSSAATQESDIKMSCSSEKLELGETAECEITKFPTDFNKDGDYDFKWIPAPSKIEDRSLDSIKFKVPEETQSPLLTVKYELEAGNTYSETNEISLENSGNVGESEVPVVPGKSNDESSGNLNDLKPKEKNSRDAVVDEKTRNQSKLTETKAEQSENQQPENQIKMSKNSSNKTAETRNSVKESDKSIEELLGGKEDENSGNNLENTSKEVKSYSNEVQDSKINNSNQKVRSLEQKIQEQKQTIKKLRQRIEELKQRNSGKEKEEGSSSLPDKDDGQEKNRAPVDSSNTERELNTRDNEDFGISSNGSLNQRESSTGESILSSIKSILS